MNKVPILGLWMKRLRKQFLDPKEQWLLYRAMQSMGNVVLIKDETRPGGWVRAGSADFNSNPQKPAFCRKALERLVAFGLIQKEAEHYYILIGSG